MSFPGALRLFQIMPEGGELTEVTEAPDRTKFLGGSDIAGVLGLSRWKTPLSVWSEKTGQVVKKDEPKLYKTLGIRLEEVVSEMFMEETGKKLIRVKERRVHPKYPMFVAQIDRLVVYEDAVWEGKTATLWLKKEWADEEIPQEYICQVMWQLAITGRKVGYISVLIGNEQFLTKKIERDPIMIAEMLKRANSFWQEFVIPKVMPMQITASDADTLYALFPNAEPDTQIDLGDEGAKLIEVRNALHQDNINLEKQIDQVENELKARLKDKESGIAGKWRVFWKNQKRKGYTVEPKEFRMFNIREVKGT